MTQPVTFTQALADHICERLIRGESLTTICDEPGMPCMGTVRLWRNRNAVFAAQYDAAREAQAEGMFEELIEIADDGTNDWMEKKGRNGTFIALNHEAIARSNMRIHTRLKMISLMNPKRYGEKAQLDLKSSDGSMSPSKMTEEAKAARIKAIYEAAANRRALATSSTLQTPSADDCSDLV